VCKRDRMELPSSITALADQLYAIDGVTAVVIGGSRAVGRERPDSDWDVGLYYRGDIDLRVLAAHGEVFAPGSWGRLMNGGSWLTLGDLRVDVLLRDLDAVDHWAREATHGRFDIDGLPGYVAGIPTYSLIAEANVAVPVRGSLSIGTTFPEALRGGGSDKWRWNRDFSLYYADMHASRGNAVAVYGQVARAIVEESHARCCAAATWVLNEKHVVTASGLDDAHSLLVRTDVTVDALRQLVADVRRHLGEDTLTST
jgi:hypothetical protein